MTTHNGTIGLAVPDKANATLSVRTYRGGFRSSFPVKPVDQNAKKRLTMTFGSGSARVELESFNGSIALRRPGDPEPEAGGRERVRTRQRLKH